MMIHEFLQEYTNFNDNRKIAGLQNLFDQIISNPERYEDIIIDILTIASDLEEDDYFGTEGLDI